MGRSPCGVAMGVSGDAQTHAGQPLSQVPVIGSGAWHLISEGPWFTSQQIWPAVQHCPPQQKSVPEQMPPLHGGVPHVPLLQNGWAPGHLLPHVPQLRMSFWWFTHTLPQQASPLLQFAAVQVLVPELLELLLLLELLVPVVVPPVP